MEDIKGLLSRENDYSSTSSSGADADYEVPRKLEKYSDIVGPLSVSSACSDKWAKIRKRNGEERLPTRRPDPNVYNRNALLARENRRKKKLYLESLEKELQEARKANQALVKALKRQTKISRQLEQQKKYFQNIIEHRTEISNIFSMLGNRELPPLDQQTSTLDVFAESSQRDPPSESFSSGSYDPEPLSSDFGIQSDLEDGVSFTNSSWDDAWNKEDDRMLAELTSPITTGYTQSPGLLKGSVRVVFDDHCYLGSSSSDIQTSPGRQELSEPFTVSPSDDVVTDAAGTCIHLNRGKDCLFCPTCHLNSTSRNPPLQLLSDELLL